MRLGRVHASTHTGRRRMQNEDVYVCSPPLFAVADGMGGAQAGELASRLAAAALEERPRELHGEEAIVALVREANARIFQRAVTDPATAGMGTTVTVALLDEEGGTLALAHVGDSRAYRLRDGELEQLTVDHSVVGELVRAGRLTEEEALQHPYRSAITRALGTEADVDVDTLTLEAAPGDLFLLCSDGLTTMVRDDEILALAASGDGDPGRIADALIDAANAAGGEDNITVVLFEISEGEPGAAPPEEAATEVATSATQPLVAAPPTDVRRWGAGSGSRWPALLLVLAVLVVGALLVWWGITQ
jgi:PPM family protein phosphatase